MNRIINIVIATTGLVILSPLLLVVSFSILLKLGFPIFFIQERIGLNGKPFKMIKFRTMLTTKGDNGELLEDSERLTKFGSWLRSTSIDELPELWNVLKGDMSVVGPRPLLTEYLPLYSEEQNRRHKVLPGITGWAQINGRNNISWEQKLTLDVWYVDNNSLLLDLKIIFKTFKKIIYRYDINKKNQATTTKFKGSVDK